MDTHILIRFLAEENKLTREIRNILNNYENQIYVSSATVEETIHLQQGGKINIKQWKSANEIIRYIKDETNFGIKYVAEEHINTLADLPYLKDHKDPFDRMIIAHAMTERLSLISGDSYFPRYIKYGLKLIFNNC